MPFSIKIGGKTHKATEFIEDPMQPWTMPQFILWDNFIGMQVQRKLANDLWLEMQAFGEQMDAMGLDHPRIGKAFGYLWGIENELMQAHIGFLAHERYANRAWESLLRREREEHDICAMFRVKPERESLLGLWLHRFGEVEDAQPILGHNLHHVAVLTASPDQKRAYYQSRFGGDYLETNGGV